MGIPYLTLEETPTREEIERMPGPVLLEFGTEWCGICRALSPQVARLLAAHPEVRHLKVEDGPGRRLGRSFGVKLWPSFVFFRDGTLITQLARPLTKELEDAFAGVTASPSP
jgi:thioredoxin 1